MSVKLDFPAQEGSSYVLVAQFYTLSSEDPYGSEAFPFTPTKDVTWTLTDAEGNIVNDREDEALTPAQTVVITLYGEDLALASGYPEERTVTLKAIYDSVFGTDLPMYSEVTFQVENLVGVRSDEGG